MSRVTTKLSLYTRLAQAGNRKDPITGSISVPIYQTASFGHPGREILERESLGFGSMISFEIDAASRVADILSGLKVFLFAESLGGVESLITYPSVQTHADVDTETRNRLGINDRLLRLSVGIEDVNDLIHDLEAVL